MIGNPELKGVWIVWGNSSNGKSRFAMQLAKYLCTFGRVAYNSLEEGANFSMYKLLSDENMAACGTSFVVIEGGNKEEFPAYLAKKNSPDIIFIDSFQFYGLTKIEYIALKKAYPKKLFIFVSHAEGKHPEGRTAKFVRYDADVKMRVEGFKCFASSRFGGGEPYVIWQEGASKYWEKEIIEE
jgi:hypothetical protein